MDLLDPFLKTTTNSNENHDENKLKIQLYQMHSNRINIHTNATHTGKQTQPDVYAPGLLSSSSKLAPRVHVSSLDASWKTTNSLSAIWMQRAGQSPRLGLRSGSLLQLGAQPCFLTLNSLESSFQQVLCEIKWIISINLSLCISVSDCG